MRKYLMSGGLATVLLLGACGDEEVQSEEESNEEMTSDNEEETTDEVTVEDQGEAKDTTEDGSETEETSDKGNRTNPYQIGETAEFTISEYDNGDLNEGTAKITIDNVLRGEEAMTAINESAEGTHDDIEEKGMEWMIFDYEYKLVEFVDDDTQYSFATNFGMFNENGESTRGTVASGVDDGDGNTLFQGGTSQKTHAQSAPDEGTVLIKFNNAEEDVFFEVDGEQQSNSNGQSDGEISSESEQEDLVDEEPVQGGEEETQIDIANITDQNTLELVIYGDYSEVDKIEAYNSAVSNGVIPQGTVSEGSAISAYESSVGIQNGESEKDQLAERYQMWVDEGIMTEEEMETELNKMN